MDIFIFLLLSFLMQLRLIGASPLQRVRKSFPGRGCGGLFRSQDVWYDIRSEPLVHFDVNEKPPGTHGISFKTLECNSPTGCPYEANCTFIGDHGSNSAPLHLPSNWKCTWNPPHSFNMLHVFCKAKDSNQFCVRRDSCVLVLSTSTQPPKARDVFISVLIIGSFFGAAALLKQCGRAGVPRRVPAPRRSRAARNVNDPLNDPPPSYASLEVNPASSAAPVATPKQTSTSESQPPPYEECVGGAPTFEAPSFEAPPPPYVAYAEPAVPQ